MRLALLDPKLEGSLSRGVLRFRCPLGHDHQIRVPIYSDPYGVVDGVKHWQATGLFPETVSLSPSIDCDQTPSCGWHGHVTGGNVSPSSQ